MLPGTNSPKRFEFGENWRRFLTTLNEERMLEAEKSLQQMLEVDDLAGRKFLDIGCGSGLFSLAARRLGAEVVSFDYDLQSVACAQTLKHRYFAEDTLWRIEAGSALDENYLRQLGEFDIVYSWGVLHHTGDMIKALANAMIPVKRHGLLAIAIYNDQGVTSRLWAAVKKTYCSHPLGRCLVTAVFVPLFALQSIFIGLFKYKNPFGHFAEYQRKRGMSIYHDWVDWLGGYPFEVATPEKIFLFYRNAGFHLRNLTTTNRLGCNQFVIQRVN